MPVVDIEGPTNSDWTRQTWDLPPYKSERFMRQLAATGMTLEEFRRLPVYRWAVKRGLIVHDEWAAHDSD